MGAREHVERLLEIAVVGERPAVAGEQRLVAGMGDGGLFEHGDRLGALPGGAQRLAIGQRRIGILGIGAVALAIDSTARRGSASGLALGSAFEAIEPVMSDMVWQPPRPSGQNRRHGRGRQKPGKTGLLTHGTLTHGIRRTDDEAE